MLLGAVLIGVGAVILLYQGVIMLTRVKHGDAGPAPVVTLGPSTEVISGQAEFLPVVSLAGTLTLGCGIFLFVLGSAKR